MIFDYKKLKDNIQTLASHKDVIVNALEFQEGLSNNMFKQLKTELGIELAPGLVELYSNTNGLLFEWVAKVGQYQYNGYINIPSVFNSIGIVYEGDSLVKSDFFHEDTLWSTYFDEAEIEDRKQFSLLESINGSDSNFCCRNTEESANKLFIIDKMQVSDTGKTIADYLAFISSTCGIQNLRLCLLENTILESCLNDKPEWHFINNLLNVK
jgi:hypothetical protein